MDIKIKSIERNWWGDRGFFLRMSQSLHLHSLCFCALILIEGLKQAKKKRINCGEFVNLKSHGLEMCVSPN